MTLFILTLLLLESIFTKRRAVDVTKKWSRVTGWTQPPPISSKSGIVFVSQLRSGELHFSVMHADTLPLYS